MLLTRNEGELRLAVLEDGKLVELLCDTAEAGSLMGNIYAGRVDNVVEGMDAAFIDIGAKQNGMLSMADLNLPRKLKRGEAIIVQVFKQPGGDKGTRLTPNLTLPGRMAVLTPTSERISISKKIADSSERNRLKLVAQAHCPEGMGLVVRTAAEGTSEEMLAEDIGELVTRWREIEGVAPFRMPPALLYQAPNLLTLVLRDLFSAEVSEMVIEGKDLFDAAMAQASVDQAERMRLHGSDVPLWTLHRVASQVEKASLRQLWLPSGAGITVDYTEALTVIDVNSGKFTGKHSLEDTLFQINCEAAIEIPRQLRLRDIGGIVIIDFIDMAEEVHRQQLLALLADELKRDRMKTNLLGMTKLGLVELTRKKNQSSMLGARASCPVCKGTGRVERKKERK